MKKILQIGMSSSLGGIEVFIKNLFDNIDHENFQFDFIDTTEKGICFKDYFKKYNCNIYKVTPRRINALKNKKELEEIIKNNHYDIIHYNLNTLSYITPIILANKYKLKIIVHSHNEWKGKNLKTLILDRINRRIISKKSIIKLACSKKAADWIFGKDDHDVVIVKNGIDTNLFDFSIRIREEKRKEFKINDSTVLLGNVGRLTEQKNQAFLIDVFSQFNNLINDSKLMIVGDGKLKTELINKVKRLHLEDKVIFTGIRQDVNELLNAFDIFIFPSLYEGLGIALIEAQCNGLLCFVSDTVPKEAKITKDYVYIPLEKSSEYWANTIKNKYKKNQRVSKAQEIKDAGYDVKKVAEKMEAIYLK